MNKSIMLPWRVVRPLTTLYPRKISLKCYSRYSSLWRVIQQHTFKNHNISKGDGILTLQYKYSHQKYIITSPYNGIITHLSYPSSYSHHIIEHDVCIEMDGDFFNLIPSEDGELWEYQTGHPHFYMSYAIP